jgi:hypothetical protein
LSPRKSSVLVVATLLALAGVTSAATESVGREISPSIVRTAGTVVVHPKFGGQILGYDIDQSGADGVFSEYVNLSNGNVLSATETFDQSTGTIISVVAKTQTMDDFVAEGVFGGHVGLVLHQHKGTNHFLTMNPLDSNHFTGQWTPPIMSGYQVEGISTGQGMRNTAAYETSFNTGLTYVFGSDVAANTFGPLISLQSIINVDDFFLPQIAMDSRTNHAVLASSLGCPEPICTTDIALVNLQTGKIRKFTDHLGTGIVDGLAVDAASGIACTTTLIDQGVEFYDLAKETGFEVHIPNENILGAGLDVEFDSVNHLFLISQFSSNGNLNDPQPRIYVYDERGNVKATVAIQRTSISPARIAINPHTRVGFIDEIVEPQHEFLEIQSFKY